ncbi:MAG: hydrogenase maturation protease [Candidatus Cyclobacteriaceae bacterium M3_2C_046]
MKKPVKILLYGYGNPGRQDDGLGIEFVDCLESWLQDEHLDLTVEVDRNYQLNVEDAETMANNDLVFFIDASRENITDFCLSRVRPESEASFSMHSVSPGYLLHLCQEMYKKNPLTYLLHIRGYKWDIKEGMSDKARLNLCKALSYLKDRIQNPDPLLSFNDRNCSIDL